MRKLSLGKKFTLLLLLALLSGIAVSWTVLAQALLQRAQDEVASKARMLQAGMNAVRTYTMLHINPLLLPMLETRADFVPEVVPAYSARKVFEYLRRERDLTDFEYKEAALNPRNPQDLADSFESELLIRFRNDPNLQDISDFRTRNGEEVFYTARPLAVERLSCLYCHRNPEGAPESMVAAYGAERGFGWEFGEVIAAQVITVPAEQVLGSARQSLATVMSVFIAAGGLVVLLINFLLRRTVIRPVVEMSRLAGKLAAGGVGPGELELDRLEGFAQRSDELGQLAQVFQQMAREVVAREQQLREQVRRFKIRIDEEEVARQVAEITGTEYFRDLKRKAQERRKEPDALGEKNSEGD